MDLDILRKLIKKFANEVKDKYDVEKVVVTYVEKAGGSDHYFVGFAYYMNEGFQPLNRFGRQDITGDIDTLFKQLTNDFLENNYSVVIFVNFTQTLETLSQELHTDCVIYGEQTYETRQKNIDKFMENKNRVIIVNIKAGGVGISLHDKLGNHPRASLISPTWSSVDLVQALGRIHRAGGKSKSLQRILYVANTIEEKIADKIQQKIANINTINNGDLDLTNIVYERERKNI